MKASHMMSDLNGSTVGYRLSLQPVAATSDMLDYTIKTVLIFDMHYCLVVNTMIYYVR